MKKFIIIGSGGSCDDQYGNECENLQVLGFVQGETADEAFGKLLVPDDWIFQSGMSYTEINAFELKSEESVELGDILCGWHMAQNEFVMNVHPELNHIDAKDEKTRIEVYAGKLKRLMENLKDGWSEECLPSITVNPDGLNPLETFWFVQDFSKAVVSVGYPHRKICVKSVEEGFRKMLDAAKSHADALAAEE